MDRYMARIITDPAAPEHWGQIGRKIATGREVRESWLTQFLQLKTFHRHAFQHLSHSS